MKKSNIKSPTLRHPIKLELRWIFGWSANKFRKSYIRKFLILADLPKLRQFADFAICEPNIFCDLRICDFSANSLCFSLLNCEINKFGQTNCGRLLGSFATQGGNFRCFVLSVLQWKVCGFANCGLAHLRNLRICDLRIEQNKFLYLQFADSHT